MGELLGRCSQLRVLATSREPLAVAGERVWQVPPPPVPIPGEGVDPEALLEDSSAVRLFVERATAVEPRFALSAYVAPADGIPLAIELAAARVETLTPAEIAGRPGHCILLATPTANHQRGRTLSTTFRIIQ